MSEPTPATPRRPRSKHVDPRPVATEQDHQVRAGEALVKLSAWLVRGSL